MEHLVVITTCPNNVEAEKLAHYLVREHLAACVNQVPGVRSVYEWQGEVREDHEIILLIKTRADAYERLEQAIKSQHPYEVPEVIALPVLRGSAAYLSWINSLVENKP